MREWVRSNVWRTWWPTSSSSATPESSSLNGPLLEWRRELDARLDEVDVWRYMGWKVILIAPDSCVVGEAVLVVFRREQSLSSLSRHIDGKPPFVLVVNDIILVDACISQPVQNSFKGLVGRRKEVMNLLR